MDFKVRIIFVILFSIYAGCTFFMVNMGFIPVYLIPIEIIDTLFLAGIVFIIINKKEILKEKDKK